MPSRGTPTQHNALRTFVSLLPPPRRQHQSLGEEVASHGLATVHGGGDADVPRFVAVGAGVPGEGDELLPFEHGPSFDFLQAIGCAKCARALRFCAKTRILAILK